MRFTFEYNNRGEHLTGRIFLIHWNLPEAEEYARKLRLGGWMVDVETEDGGRAFKNIKITQPQAVVICLTRLPSHGRETGNALKSTSATHDIPIIFVDGNSEVVEKTRQKVPEAIYTNREELVKILKNIS
jgi:CheY-like chemotaxis protein